MFSAKLQNSLEYYTLQVNESPEMAEKMALAFEEKFGKLGKYDQMDMAMIIERDGWETAFEKIETL